MVVTPMERLRDVGAYWEELGGIWGGEFRDPVHFEYPGFKEWLKGAAATDQNVLNRLLQSYYDWGEEHPFLSLLLPAQLTLQKNLSLSEIKAALGF